MNELTKEHTVRTQLNPRRAYPGGTWCSFCRKELCKSNEGHKAFAKEDVILAVEETIKRIEEEMKSSENIIYCSGLFSALQIIKEQFPIIEKVEK